jgi:hypothetical protein
LFTRRITSAVGPPGKSVDVGESPPTKAATVTVCMVPALADPDPEPEDVK